jgi:hypothetical protein
LSFLHDLKGIGLLRQVDGPMHFLAPAAPAAKGGSGRRERGATRLKRRLLERAGWRVATVPYWEWKEAALGGAAGEQVYLERLLEQYGAPTPQLSRNRTHMQCAVLWFGYFHVVDDCTIWSGSSGAMA